jgi:MFS family permease
MSGRIRADLRTTFRSFEIRNFRLFYGGQFVSQIGNWLTMVGLTLFVLRLTDSGIAVGALAAFQFGPVLVIGAWAGLVADRVDKRRLLLITQSLAMLQSFALAALAFTGDPPLASIYGVALLGGCIVAFDNPARRSFVNELVPETHLNNAVSLNTAIMTSSRIFGPALAGLLVSTVGYGWCFGLDGLTYFAVLYGLWRIDASVLLRGPLTQRAKGQVRAGLGYARTAPELWIPLMMMAIIGTFTYNFQVVMPLLVKHTFHAGDGTFTLLYSVLSIGSVVGALLGARREEVTVRTVIVSAIAFAASMSVFALVPNLAFTFPVGAVVGATSVWFMTSSSAIIQMRTAPAMRGRVLSLQTIVFLGSTPIGGPIIGAVCELYSPRLGIAVGAAAAFAAALYGVTAWRANDATVSNRPGPGGTVTAVAAGPPA